MPQPPLTIEQMQEAVNTRAKYKTAQEGANALGLTRGTFNSRVSRAVAAGIVATVTTHEQQTAVAEKVRIRDLEEIVKAQQKELDALHAQRYVLLPTAAKKSTAKTSFIRVIIPDSHGASADPKAMSALFGDLERIGSNVREVVGLGDHLECGGFLAEHHTLAYVAQNEYSFTDDCDAANQHLDMLQKLCPKAVFHYIEGNHERRIEQWIVNKVVGSSKDKKILADLFSTASVLHLAKRKITLYSQGVFYDGIPIPSTIKLGQCYFTHGTRTNKHAASATLDDFGGNVVYGHTHRADSYIKRTVKDGSIGAWNFGCLCRLQPLWQHTNPTTWSHGYGIQLVQPDGAFLTVPVPIVDGVSYLHPLIDRIAS